MTAGIFNLDPSTAFVWGPPEGCTAAPQMSRSYNAPEKTEAQLEGTSAHLVAAAETIARLRTNVASPFKEGDQTPNGIIVDETMLDFADMCATQVVGKARELGVFGKNIGVEMKVEAPQIHPQCKGRCDAFLFHEGEKRSQLHIWEFKYGRSTIPAYENWPMICYSVGILNFLEIALVQPDIEVHFHVIQPRAFSPSGPIRTWKTTTGVLRTYWNILHNSAHEVFSENRICRSGPQCARCAINHDCSTALAAGVQLYEIAMQPTRADMTPEQLGVMFSIIKRAHKQLETLKTAYTAQVKMALKDKKSVPGWMLEQNMSNRQWTADVPAVKAMGESVGIQLVEEKLITPAEAERRGFDKNLVNMCTKKVPSGYSVKQDDLVTIKEIFSNAK